MKLAVVGADAAPVRRALDEARKRGSVASASIVDPRAPVERIAEEARKCDAVLAGAYDPAISLRVALAAIAARRPAVLPSWAASEHRSHLDLDADAREVGVTLVTGASASPALPVVLARHAARRFSEVRSVEVAWAIPPRVMGDARLWPALLEGMRRPAIVRPAGRFAYASPGRPDPVAFPEPVGIQRAGLFGGPEAWTLSDLFSSRPWVRVSLGGTVPWWRAASAPQRVLRHAGVASRLAAAASVVARASGDPGWAGVRVEVEGSVDGPSVTEVLGGFDRIDDWDAAAVVIAIETLADGAEPGVVVTGGTIPPVTALSTCYDLGVRFAVFEPSV